MYIRTYRVLLLLCFFSSAGIDAGAFDFSCGGSVFFSQMLDVSNIHSPTLKSSAASLEPVASFSDPILEVRLSVRTDTEKTHIAELGESWVHFFPFDWLSVQLGRFETRIGTAFFLTNLSWFSPFVPETLLTMSQAPVLTDQIRIRLLAGDAYAGISLVPIGGAGYILPDTGSVFFPKNGLLPGGKSPFGSTFALKGISVEPLQEPDPGTRIFGDLLLEAGFSSGMADMRGAAFFGIERDPVYRTGVILNGLYPDFNFTLQLFPFRNYVQSYGFAFSLSPEFSPFGSATLLAEGTLTFGRSAVTKSTVWRGTSVSGQLLRGEIVKVDESAVTLGGSFDFSFLPVSVFSEYRSIVRPVSGPATILPVLSQLVIGGIRSKLLDEMLELLALAAYSPLDGGWAFAVNCTFRIFSDSFLFLRYPWFSGPPVSDLGQFSGISLLSVGFEGHLY